MYKIKVYKNGKLFAENDVNDYLLMDDQGQAFCSTGESVQQFILNVMTGNKDQQEEGDLMEPPEEKTRKSPTQKDKMALRHIIEKMDKDAH